MERNQDSWLSKKIGKFGKKVGKELFEAKEGFFDGYKLSLKEKGWKKIEENKNRNVEVFVKNDETRVILRAPGAKKKKTKVKKSDNNYLYVYASSPHKNYIKKVQLPSKLNDEEVEIDLDFQEETLIISLNRLDN